MFFLCELCDALGEGACILPVAQRALLHDWNVCFVPEVPVAGAQRRNMPSEERRGEQGRRYVDGTTRWESEEKIGSGGGCGAGPC